MWNQVRGRYWDIGLWRILKSCSNYRSETFCPVLQIIIPRYPSESDASGPSAILQIFFCLVLKIGLCILSFLQNLCLVLQKCALWYSSDVCASGPSKFYPSESCVWSFRDLSFITLCFRIPPSPQATLTRCNTQHSQCDRPCPAPAAPVLPHTREFLITSSLSVEVLPPLPFPPSLLPYFRLTVTQQTFTLLIKIIIMVYSW